MKPKALLDVRIIDNKSVAISGSYTRQIKFLGSTMRASRVPDSDIWGEGETHIVLYPEPGQDGIVALIMVDKTINGKTVEWTRHTGFLKLGWRDKDGLKCPFVDMDEFWIPSLRVGQVSSRKGIEVELTSGRRFASHLRPFDVTKQTPVNSVPDGNLLCRYLFGTATVADVVHGAVQAKVEVSREERIRDLELSFRNLAEKFEAVSLEKGRLTAVNAALEEQNSHLATFAADYRLALKLTKEGLLASGWFYALARFVPEFMRTKKLESYLAAFLAVKEHEKPVSIMSIAR